MIILKKQQGKDFVVLNLTDPQLSQEEWEPGHKNRNILEYTLTELVSRVKPDLITISGDLAWPGKTEPYEALAAFVDSFGIPWAPVWGTHDNECGPDFVEKVVRAYTKYSNFLYERGPAEFGNGNYVIAVEEDGRIVEGLIMLDSHNREDYTDAEGNVSSVYAKLLPEQIDWYRQQIEVLKAKGCEDTTMILHIPIYAYRQAFEAALRSDLSKSELTPEMFLSGECWNEEYKDSVGGQFEDICSHEAEDGVLNVITTLNSTKHVIAGHDHVNNWMIRYQGVRLIYGLKTGAGCYWHPRLNGGTVLRIDSNGVRDVYHEYVDVEMLL